MQRFFSVVVSSLVAVSVSIAAQNPSQQPPAAPAPPSNGIIIGTVVDELTGKPIAGAIARIGQTAGEAPRMGAPQALTGSDGRFMFTKLPAGIFQFTASRSGYLPAGFENASGFPIVLSKGQTRSDVRIALAKPASISGTIVDENGDPVVGATVYTLRRLRNLGRMTWMAEGNATTDDRGMYRFGYLPPGDRVVMVEQTNASVPTSVIEAYQKAADAAKPGEGNPMFDELFSTNAAITAGGTQFARVLNSQSQTLTRSTVQPRADASGRLFVYPSTIYPAATSIAKAGIIALRSGEDRTGIDITLRPVRTITISGTVVGPNGPVGLTAVTLSTPDPMDGRSMPNQVGTVSDASGAFTLIAVPPGDYTLRVTHIPVVRVQNTMVMNTVTNSDGTTSVTASSSGPAVIPPLPPDPTLWVEQPLSAGDRDILGLTVALRFGARLSGRVEFNGTLPQPTAKELQAMQVSLAPMDGMRAFRMPRARIDERGELTTQGFPTGRYSLQVFGMSAWSMLSATAGGIDILDHPLTIGVSDISDIVITYTDRPTELSGTVTERGTTPPKEALVIVFPADALLNADDMNLRRIQSTRAASNGSFTLKNLPPGDYQLVAINDSSKATDLSAELLQSLAGKTTRVRLALGEKRSQSLTLVAIR